MGKKVKEVKNEVIKYTPEEFNKALEELCVKMGYRINVTPAFYQQDNGTFSIKLTTSLTVIK